MSRFQRAIQISPLLLLLQLQLVLSARATVVAGVGLNFTAGTYNVDSSALPPDCNGAAGFDQYVEFINGRVSVFRKTDGARLQTMTDLAFWSQAGVSIPVGWDVTDPRIIFDPTVGRWFASQCDFDPLGVVNTNHFLLAVSATADATGVWKGVSFTSDPGSGNFADFPTLGLDAEGVYFSGDLFDSAGNSVGATLVSVPKSDLLVSPPSVANRAWFGNLSYSARGEILQPAVCLDGSSSGVILAAGDLGFDYLKHSNLVASTVLNAGGPGATLASPATITVPAYTIPLNPTQPNGDTSLDDGDARISATVYAVGGILYAAHSVEVNNRAAVQWFRLNATDDALLESGIISDPNLDLFYPSIAANRNGTVVIGCNGSSLGTFVSTYAIVGQTRGGVTTFGNLILLKAGIANYNNSVGGYNRWGDYSAVCVDPADSTRFWTIQMFPSARNVWSTQVTELLTGELRLTVAPAGTNVLVSWPSLAANYLLQSTSDFTATNTWSPVTQSIFTNGNQISVLVPAAGGQQFFRLQAGP